MILAWQLPLAAGDWVSILVFLIFVFGSLIAQWAKKNSGETDEEESPMPRRQAQPPRSPPSRPQPPGTAQSEEIRKFLEALGKPRSAPPPILRPVQEVAGQRPPQRRPKLQGPPPVVQRRPTLVTIDRSSNQKEEEGPRNVITGESTRQPLKQFERVDLGKEIAAAELEVAQTARPMTAVASVAGVSRAAYFARLLANKTNVRQAVVLAEVIGPPKALG